MAEAQPQQNPQVHRDGPRDAVYIGKKPLMAYVTSTLIQLAESAVGNDQSTRVKHW